MGLSAASKRLLRGKTVSKVKDIVKTTKLVGYDLPKEILKRTFSSKYYKKKVIDPALKK